MTSFERSAQPVDSFKGAGSMSSVWTNDPWTAPQVPKTTLAKEHAIHPSPHDPWRDVDPAPASRRDAALQPLRAPFAVE